MSATKQRHGCLTAWLILMIVINSMTAVVMPLMAGEIHQATPSIPVAVVWLLALGAVANVVFAVALFKWKKWGFYGCVATGLWAFCLNVSTGTGIPQAFLGLSGIAILYGVLQIGGSKRGWSQLE